MRQEQMELNRANVEKQNQCSNREMADVGNNLEEKQVWNGEGVSIMGLLFSWLRSPSN
jgi:hypothetical protein